MPRRSLIAACAACMLLASADAAAAPPAAAAPEDDDTRAAQQQFAIGQKAFTAGDFRAAAKAFEEAYRLKPHHAPLWNAARAWHRAGENVRAANLYAKYLREAPTGTKDRDVATQALAELSAKLGKVTIQTTGPTDLKVDDVPNDPDGLFVAPGEHVASGKARNETVRKNITLAAGQSLSVTIDSPPLPVVPPAPGPAPQPKPAGFHLPWVVVAVGGVLALGGGGLTIWSGLDTNSKRAQYRTLYDNGTATQENLDDGFARQRRTNILLAATVGMVALTGVAAIFVNWKGDPKTGLVVQPTLNGAAGYWY